MDTEYLEAVYGTETVERWLELIAQNPHKYWLDPELGLQNKHWNDGTEDVNYDG